MRDATGTIVVASVRAWLIFIDIILKTAKPLRAVVKIILTCSQGLELRSIESGPQGPRSVLAHVVRVIAVVIRRKAETHTGLVIENQ